MDGLDIGHDGAEGHVGGVHVRHHALCDRARHVGVFRFDGSYGVVVAKLHVVEGRHVEAVELCGGGAEEFFFRVGTVVLHAQVQGGQLRQGVLAFADGEDVHERSHGLGIVGAGAAGDDHGVVLSPVRTPEGDPGEGEHIQHVGVAQLVLHGERHDIEVTDGIAAVEGEERHGPGAHFVLHVGPGRVDPLAPDPVHLVQDAAEDPHAEIRHADLVAVREAERHPEIHRGQVLHHGAHFPTGVPSRLRHGRYEALNIFSHGFPRGKLSRKKDFPGPLSKTFDKAALRG